MSSTNRSLSDDLKQAHAVSRFHVWNGVIATAASFVIPLFGLLAIYSDYTLVQLMERRWVGTLFGAFGAVNFLLWVAILLFVV
jgi:hypothetical protein